MRGEIGLGGPMLDGHAPVRVSGRVGGWRVVANVRDATGTPADEMTRKVYTTSFTGNVPRPPDAPPDRVEHPCSPLPV